MKTSILDLYALLLTDLSQVPGVRLADLPAHPFDGEGLDAARANSPELAAALAIAKSFAKKCTDIVSDSAGDVCLLSFLESNYDCSTWALPSGSSSPNRSVNGRLQSRSDYMGWMGVSNLQLLESMRSCFRDTFARPVPLSLLRDFPDFEGENPWSWGNIIMCGDIGPGAALGASGTSWYDKFYQSTLTYTHPVLLEAYQEYASVGFVRRLAELQRDQTFGSSLVLGEKFGSVPKTFKTDRSIGTQPSVNMWAQKGLARIMSYYLRDKYGFDVATQPFVNQELARRASLHDTMATIDLKEASNRIPRGLIEFLCDAELLDRLTICRCDQTVLPWGERVPLYSFSSMGNGYTFMLMTAVFLAAVEASYDAHNEPLGRTCVPRSRTPGKPADQRVARELVDLLTEQDLDFLVTDKLLNNGVLSLQEAVLPSWGVFGDDIICHRAVLPELHRLLVIIGAQVNLSKSYESGPFRESCGADWFLGFPVRGVYCKSVSSLNDRFVLLNRLVEWTAVTGIPLRRVCSALWRSVSDCGTLVPLAAPPDSGVRVTRDWVKPERLRSKHVEEVRRNLQCAVYPYTAYMPIARTRTFTGAECIIYGAGLLLSMLRGETSSVKAFDPAIKRRRGSVFTQAFRLLLRAEGPPIYELRWCWTTCWDSTLDLQPNAAKMDAAIRQNLGHVLSTVDV